ncbi:MAG: hypothetical protein EAZ32_06315 [Cytophagia bacterium]|nr:MAG: hypothetical protein EAZ38_12315 [Cytophagales bacterium]TAG40482.1 MAG: hypothetical protein EAZ32_06315 [Cytophagia bacterium]TAG80355.1 MAG: hypothetical protein EAZ22_09560 [Cytophagales bacterium]
MSKRIINDSIHNWVNNNRELLAPYKGQWVAHNANEVLASAPTGSALVQSIKDKKITNYTIVFVHPTWFAKPVRFLPIRFKTSKKHEWTPNYEVTIAGAAQHQTVEMLIDSGADEVSDIIIGREVIFDTFDVAFKQADEMIVFKKREVITNKINH